MTITRQYALPKHHLTAPAFDRALVFTRTHQRTQQIARAYLVEHVKPGVIAAQFTTSKQNVYRAANQLINDAKFAASVLGKVVKRWNHLNIPPSVAAHALPFLMQETTLEDAAAQAGCSLVKVIDACKEVVALFHAATYSDLAEKEAAFRRVMRHSRVRERAFQVSYDGFVLGMSLSDLAERHGISRQHAYNIMHRFRQLQDHIDREQ